MNVTNDLLSQLQVKTLAHKQRIKPSCRNSMMHYVCLYLWEHMILS